MQVVFLLQERAGIGRWLDAGIFSTMDKAKAYAPEGAEWKDDMGGLHSEAKHVYRPDTILAPSWADYRIMPSLLDPEKYDGN